jgi:hypothetical protein
MKMVSEMMFATMVVAAFAAPTVSAMEAHVPNPIDELTQCIGEMTEVTTDQGWVVIDQPTGYQTGLALALTETRTDAAFYQYVSHLGTEDAPTSVTYLVTGYTTQVNCSASCLCPGGWTVGEYVDWGWRTINNFVSTEVAISELMAQATCDLP